MCHSMQIEVLDLSFQIFKAYALLVPAIYALLVPAIYASLILILMHIMEKKCPFNV